MFLLYLSNINEFVILTNKRGVYVLEQFSFFSETASTDFKLKVLSQLLEGSDSSFR